MSCLSTPMQLVLTLVKTQSQVLKPLESALSTHGVSFTEWLVMHRLSQACAHSLKRASLAGSVGLTASGVTRLLLPMEKRGWIEKSTNARDARISLVKLTPPGLALYEDATNSLEFGAKKLTTMLNEHQIEQCLGLLSSLHISAIEASQLS